MNFKNIPLEMRAHRQWICWQLKERAGAKPTKLPINPHTGQFASVTEPNDWGSYEEAVAASKNFSGIGFVFTKSDPFAGIDLDETHDDAEAYARQIKIFKEFSSYSELSPSGRGLHIIIKANLPGKGRRRASIELYDNERYFTMTGDVHHNAPIENRQELAELLYTQMGGAPETYRYGDDQAEKQTDENIIAIASKASNGDKFQALFAGDWNGLYPSQSEADFALVDIVAFYTQNRQQIARIFLKSGLGQRDKAKRSAYIGYMVEKSFDRQLPPIDTDGLTIAFENMLAERNGAEGKSSEKPSAPGDGSSATTSIVEQALARSSAPSSFPPGLVGEIAQFIYDAAPRPVREIALAGAYGLLAGIAGRAYNVSGTGLNQYVLLVAETGKGKEAIAGGISKLMAALKASVPSSQDFVGPSEIASPQAVLKWLARSPAFYSIVGEFGLKLKEMSALHANPNVTGLKRMLLDLYNKSGKGNALGAMAYSKREDNTAVVAAPAFTLIGESTPSKFFENVNEDMVQDGLLPRFMVIEYSGPRVAFHKGHKLVQPSFQTVSKLAELAAHCLKFAATNTVCEIAIEPAAEAIFDAFDKWIDSLINDKSIDVVAAELWNRAHIKAMKLAGLYAVGTNYINPSICADMAQMACDEIYRQTIALKSRFDTGDVGSATINFGANETKQLKTMLFTIGKWAIDPWSQHMERRWRVSQDMQRQKIFPFNSLLSCLNVYREFREDRRGGSEAVRKIYQQLLDNDDLREIPKADMQKKFGKSCRAFAISNPERFIEAVEEAA